MLGVAGSLRARPRVLLAGLHRNLPLLAIAFVTAHVLTTLADGYAPIGVKDAVLPFLSPYRPVWLGLGTVAFDLLLALVATSLLRARIGLRGWRAVHWLAYLSWPVALMHGLGTGTDGKSGWLLVLTVVCTLAVAAAVVLRVLLTPELDGARRLVALGAVPAVMLVLFIWAKTGPLQHGWALRAGTPASLIPAASRGVSTTAKKPRPTVQQHAPATPLPYTATVSGSLTQAQPNSSGIATVQIDARTSGPIAGRLRATLYGVPLGNGGLSMQSSDVAYATAGSPGCLPRAGRRARGHAHHRRRRRRGRETPPPRPRSADQPLLRLGRRNPAGAPLRREPHERLRLAPSARAPRGWTAGGHRPSICTCTGRCPARLERGSLLDAVERSELRGRGGAGFPTALKLRAVAGGRGRKVVLANGVEGEPPSGKDKVLLRYVPHLVLDGVEVAAHAVGADQAIVAVSRPGGRARRASERAPRAEPRQTASRSESRLFRTRSSPAKRPL